MVILGALGGLMVLWRPLDLTLSVTMTNTGKILATGYSGCSRSAVGGHGYAHGWMRMLFYYRASTETQYGNRMGYGEEK